MVLGVVAMDRWRSRQSMARQGSRRAGGSAPASLQARVGRRAANALLGAAAQLAALADEMADVKARHLTAGALPPDEQRFLDALAAKDMEARRCYEEALERYQTLIRYARAG